MTWVHPGRPASVCFGSCSYRGKTQISDQKLNRGPAACPLCPGHTTCWVPRLFRCLQGLSVPLGSGWADKRGSLVSKRGRDREPRRGWAPVLAVMSWAGSSLNSPISKMGEFSSALTLLPKLCPQGSETSAVFEGQGGDSSRSCGWMHKPPHDIRCFQVP